MPVKATARHIRQTLVTGLLAALPLAATVAVVVWLVRLLTEWLGPGSFVGGLLVYLGLDLVSSELLSYLIGLGIVVVAIYALGLAVQTRLKGVWHAIVTGVMTRIPVVRNIYDLVRKFVDLLSQRDENATRSMRPVWLQFGGGTAPGPDGTPGKPGAAVLGLLSTAEPVWMNGEAYVGVIVPTAPVPVGGALVYVPQSWVRPAEVGVEGLTSIYVSMGVTSKEHLGGPPTPPAAAKVAAPPPPPPAAG